jgi:hypothetical protein
VRAQGLSFLFEDDARDDLGRDRDARPLSRLSGKAMSGQAELVFGGTTYDPELDYDRLARQFERVRALMSDGAWRTLREIADELGHPEASISARLRDLRKEKFGGFLVERRRRGDPPRGLFEYRLQIPVEADP